MKVSFSKMHGLGQDIVLVDNVTQNVFFSTEQIKKLAHRKLGIGFERLISVEPPYDPDMDFYVRTFASTGEEVALCLQGARCVARFLRAQNLIYKEKVGITTRGYSYVLFYEGEHVSIEVKPPILKPSAIPFQSSQVEQSYLIQLTSGESYTCGVMRFLKPHCILMVDKVADFPIEKVGKQLAKHEKFPEGAVIGFLQKTGDKSGQLRVFDPEFGEHPDSAFSACAAAYWAFSQRQLLSPATISLPSGSLTITRWNHQFLRVRCPAEFIFDGQFDL